MPRSLSKVVAAALLLKGILMAQPAQASGEPGVTELLHALKREYEDVRIGQMHAPFSRLPMEVDSWTESWSESLGLRIHTALSPIFKVRTASSLLAIPVDAMGYSTSAKGELRAYVLRVESLRSAVCITYDDIAAVFPWSKQIINYPVPHYSHSVPGSGSTTSSVVISESEEKVSSFEFGFGPVPLSGESPRCAQRFALRAAPW